MGKITIVDQFFMVGSGFVFLLLETPDLFFLFFSWAKESNIPFFFMERQSRFFSGQNCSMWYFLVKIKFWFRCSFSHGKTTSKFLVLIFFARTCRPKTTNLQMPRQTQRPPSSGCCGCAPCTCDPRLWPSQQCWKAWLGKSSLVN